MKTIKTLLASIALLLCSGTMNAHDFEVDGIYYNILSENNKTVEVTFKGDTYSSKANEYTDSVTIPQKVDYEGNEYAVTGDGELQFVVLTSIQGAGAGVYVELLGNHVGLVVQRDAFPVYSH